MLQGEHQASWVSSFHSEGLRWVEISLNTRPLSPNLLSILYVLPDIARRVRCHGCVPFLGLPRLIYIELASGAEHGAVRVEPTTHQSRSARENEERLIGLRRHFGPD